MTTALELLNGFHLSHQKVYMDGDPMPYVGDVTIPGIVHPTETFDNSSTSGPMDLADPFRYGPSGDGEVKFEGFNATVMKKVLDASLLQDFIVSQAITALDPTASMMLPIPVKHTIGAQFFDVNFGTQRAGTKRELTAKYKMTSYKYTEATVDVIEMDFVAGVMMIDGVDLMVAVNTVL